jgi:hypothetical protein
MIERIQKHLPYIAKYAKLIHDKEYANTAHDGRDPFAESKNVSTRSYTERACLTSTLIPGLNENLRRFIRAMS